MEEAKAGLVKAQAAVDSVFGSAMADVAKAKAQVEGYAFANLKIIKILSYNII